MTRVLLVEPDPARRDRLAMAIRRARHEVRSTPDPSDAPDRAREHPPAVVVCAAGPGGRTLAAVVQGLRADPGTARPKVVALLSPGNEADREAAIAAGADLALPCHDDVGPLLEAIAAVGEGPATAEPAGDAEREPAHRVADAMRRMPGAVLLACCELEDIAAMAAADGADAAGALDRRWHARLAALLPEQASWWPDGPGRVAVLLPQSTPAPHALLAALAGTGQPTVRAGGREIRMRAAVGAVHLGHGPAGAEDAARLLARAEHALRSARAGTRPKVHVAGAGDAERDLDDMELATHVQHALERGSFRLVFQPRVRMPDGQAAGAEALLRWTMPGTGEPVPPARLLAVADEAGLLDEVAGWALREACRRAATWERAGTSLPVSVNVAASQLRRGNLPDEVRLALSESGLPGGMLALEVGEATLAAADASMRAQLEAVRVAGVRVVIDDFGTGVAGVALLHGCPVDEAKLDRSLVARLPGTAEDRAVVEAAVRHARRNGVVCAAEGVEDAPQWACLADAGVAVAQGWLVARPMDADAVPGFVQAAPRRWDRAAARG